MSQLQAYFFEIEHLSESGTTCAYIWREQDDPLTGPPVKTICTTGLDDQADKRVSTQAADWIRKNGVFV